MNWSKSNTIFSRAPTECNLEIEGERVKNVKETVYLGVKLSEDGKLESEVERRIGMTMQAVGAMKMMYESREISREAKSSSVQSSGGPNTDIWVRVLIMGSKGEGKVQAAGSRDEGAEEDCRFV